MTCPQCGAAVKQGDGRFCSHCGAALPDRPRITPEEWVTHRERFEQAAKDPQHAIAQALPAPSPRLGVSVTMLVVFLAVWIAAGAFIIAGFAHDAGAMVVMPILIVSVGVIGVVAQIVRSVAKARAPVERAIAVVVDERTEVSSSSSGDHHHTHTSYYATLQLEDGARRELETAGAVSGMTTKGDIGLAVMRGGELIDFHRFARV